jgi:hypothetical protein
MRHLYVVLVLVKDGKYCGTAANGNEDDNEEEEEEEETYESIEIEMLILKMRLQYIERPSSDSCKERAGHQEKGAATQNGTPPV